MRYGRTDPATDPQGQNIIFTMLLAQQYYHQPDLVSKILGDYQVPHADAYALGLERPDHVHLFQADGP